MVLVVVLLEEVTEEVEVDLDLDPDSNPRITLLCSALVTLRRRYAVLRHSAHAVS